MKGCSHEQSWHPAMHSLMLMCVGWPPIAAAPPYNVCLAECTLSGVSTTFVLGFAIIVVHILPNVRLGNLPATVYCPGYQKSRELCRVKASLLGIYQVASFLELRSKQTKDPSESSEPPR